MNNEIQKPMSIAAEELTANIVAAINDAPLPLFVIEYVVRDVYDEIKKLSQKQYEQDKERYENSLAEHAAFVDKSASSGSSKKDAKNK